MNRGDLGIFLGLAGLACGVAALVSANAAKSDASAIREATVNEVAAEDAKMQSAEATKAAAWRLKDEADRKATRDALRSLEERVAKLESARGVAGTGTQGDGKALEVAAQKAAADQALFDDLEKKVLDGDATADEQAQFWAMLREKPQILGDLMKQLEKAVAANPGDVEARMRLSKAYIEKLLTVPDGPEKGAWSTKAMEQYKKILDIDPNHWGARYRLAFNYSQWPDFLNKRPDAIREFETLKKIQEGQTQEPHFAQTYFQLRQLYLKDGRTADANAVLDEGLRRFPDDEELKKAKDGAK